MGHADLRAIVEFIYRGETYVTRDQLSSIVRVAELLKIKGTIFFKIYLIQDNKLLKQILLFLCFLGLCEVSQQQNETQSVGNTMSHSLPLPPAADHQSGSGNINNYTNVNDNSMTSVAASLVPSNTVVSMATMTQPPAQLNQLTSPNSGQQGNAARPTYSPSYRGRPRGRRPSGASGSGRGGFAGGAGEKRNAATAGLPSGGVRRPTRGTYRGSWPSSRSPSKSSPTGSNQSTVHGSNSQGIN